METFIYFLSGAFFVLAWTYVVYRIGYSAGFARYREIQDVVRNSTKNANEHAK